jgi:hypothetical protein
MIALLALWRPRRWTVYEVAALAYASFLVLTPGFAVQYLVSVVPLLTLVAVRRSAVFAAAGGLFLFAMYCFGPFTRWSTIRIGPTAYAVGLVCGVVAWSVLISFLVRGVILKVRRAPGAEPGAYR